MELRTWLITVVGLFALLGGVMDWEWFMAHRKARFMVMLFGRKGARLFYIVLGVALTSFGLLLTTGLIAP